MTGILIGTGSILIAILFIFYRYRSYVLAKKKLHELEDEVEKANKVEELVRKHKELHESEKSNITDFNSARELWMHKGKGAA